MKHTYILAFAAVTLAYGCGASLPQQTGPKTTAARQAEVADAASTDGTSNSLASSDRSKVEDSSSKRTPAPEGSNIILGANSEPGEAKAGSSDASNLGAPASDGASVSQTQPHSATEPTSADHDESDAVKCRESDAKLSITVDRRSVSLEDGRLVAKMDGPICHLAMRITNREGQPILEKTFKHTESESDLHWNPIPRDQIEKIEIRITARDGAYQSVLLIPWSVSIDHEEVQFDTNKAIIRESEVASLNESLTTINRVLAKVEDKGLGTITLFIAGHTDTQGSAEHNLLLSRSRAQAIAEWFVKKGLCVPIAYEGFGETALKKLTADNVDEQANRRVDYILSVEPPIIKQGATPAWKWLSKGC
ncbi:MAG TPA: OmpA family protein [Polyangiaceae bacterium]